MNNVSKKKIAAGYAVLLAVLLYSLFFVHREMAVSYTHLDVYKRQA